MVAIVVGAGGVEIVLVNSVKLCMLRATVHVREHFKTRLTRFLLRRQTH